MEPIVVVGAGLSGVTCARTVAEAGLPVTLLERSRKPGGRMASRQVEGRRVDLGASYLTVSDDRFAAVVDRWQGLGLARPWTDTFDVRDPDGSWQPKPGPLRWGAPSGLRSLVEHQAEGLDVRTVTVTEVDLVEGRPHAEPREGGRAASAVVLAMPDPQARRLLGPSLEDVAAALDDPFDPILALTAVWEERRWDLDGVFVNGSDVLSWVADDGRRRGDGAPVLVAHSTPDLARRHLDDPDSARDVLVAELCSLLDLPEPRHAEVHRWTFAKPAAASGSSAAADASTRPAGTFLLTDEGIGCCGDAWWETAKVEGAFLSGLELGEALVARFG